VGLKKRVKGSAAQIGNLYEDKPRQKHANARTHGSGRSFSPQSRSVDSMKSPGHGVLFSYDPSAKKKYVDGNLHHEGYYGEYPEAVKSAKKNKGVVVKGTGIYSTSFEVFAPVSKLMIVRAKAESRASGSDDEN